MRAKQPNAVQPYVLLRHRDTAPCMIAREVLIARKRASDRIFIRRAATYIVLWFASVPVGLRLVRFAEGRGYFDWAAEVDVRPIVFAIAGLLIASVVWLVAKIEKKKRRGFSPPCPQCGNPLIGANLWPPAKVAGDKFIERRQQRMQKLKIHTASKYVIGPAFIVMLVSFPLSVLITQGLRPDLDPNSWPFVIRGLFLVVVLYLISGYLFTLSHVRALIRRKGRERALRFLFQEAINGQSRWRDGVFYRVLGIADLTQQTR